MCRVDVHGNNALLLSLQTVCIHMVTVDSCFSFNKIRLKKLVVHSLICHLTEGPAWGLPYPVLSEQLIGGFDSHRDECRASLHLETVPLQASKWIIPHLKENAYLYKYKHIKRICTKI